MVDKIWYNMEELIGGSEERVLIETYWNVKNHIHQHRKNGFFCINRNILECKASSGSRTGLSTGSINRNILECKDVR